MGKWFFTHRPPQLPSWTPGDIAACTVTTLEYLRPLNILGLK